MSAMPANLRVMAVSPHPDDVALSAGGLIWKLHSSNTIRLLTVFGRSRWVSHSIARELRDSETITALRAEEERNYAEQLAADCNILPYEDASLRSYDAVSERLKTHDPASWREQVKASVRMEIARYRPHLLIGPAGIGNHIDHVIVSEAINELERIPDMAVLFYQDLPYATEPELRAGTPNRFDIAGVLDIDIEAGLDQKVRNLGLYASQIDNKLCLQIEEHARKVGNGSAAERYWIKR